MPMNKIKVKFPARISMNLFTYPNKLVKGGYGVAIKMNNYLSISKSDKDSIKVKSVEDNVDLLIKYYLEKFRKISNFKFKVNIVLELDDRFKNHVGYAFNSNIACAIYYALNKIIDDRFTKDEILKYLFETYAELNNSSITRNDSTCMISQHCALNGGLNIIDDLKLIYNYKFPINYKIALIYFDDKIINNNIEEIKQKKKQFIPMSINYIRQIFNNNIIPELDNDNIKNLKVNNLKILKGSTRILRCENYLCGDEMIKVMEKLSTNGIVGLTSSSSTIYFISKDMKKLNLKNRVDYFEIDNQGITII